MGDTNLADRDASKGIEVSPRATLRVKRMLGYLTISHWHCRRLNRRSQFCNHAPRQHLRCLLGIAVLASIAAPRTCAQQSQKPSAKGGVADLSAAGPQRRQGDLFIADDNVEIRYANQRLRADHVEYNDQTNEAYARGHVVYDRESQHLEADEAHYNISTGRGTFVNVRGAIKVERRGSPNLLVTDNPLYFEGKSVEKFGADLYVLHQTWITVCDPRHPKWQFFAPHARVRVGKTMALVNANFRLFRVPLIWTPYATAPAGSKIRQSGLLVPVAGNSTAKGFVFGDALYWAPVSWADTTLGAELLTKRGSAQRAQFRIAPWEDTALRYNYFAVIDRLHQGGHEQQLEVRSIWSHNWRFVADVNELSSLTFRLVFADNYGEAINSEVRSSVFLTHNFNGFSLNFASLSDRSFLTINPQTSVYLRDQPQARFGSVEQAPWRNLPVYFSVDTFADALHREDVQIFTPARVARTELAPRMTLPFHIGPWLSATTTAAFRTTYYGDSLVPRSAAARLPLLSGQSIVRNDGEFTLDLRPPVLERVFDPSPDKTKLRKRYKHTIEPLITYRYITGINDFSRFIRFDADATLTNTNEVEYGITQRLWSKDGDSQPQELVSWNLVQKHYFNPTFSGAIFNGQRNVIEPLDSITPFAFAFGPRNSSPLVSDFKITPGGRFDTEQILEYDPLLHKITVIGTLEKVKPYKKFFATVAHFRLQANPILQPLSNQVRALVGYGSETREGFNFTGGVSYDFTNNTLQNELIQFSYNGKCCGLAVAYQRIELGQVRTDNRFRVAFIIANIGSFGNLRHEEKLF
jgi:LPS-assembly protein